MLTRQHIAASIPALTAAIGVFQVCLIPGTSSCMLPSQCEKMLTHQHIAASVPALTAAIGVFQVCLIPGTSSCMLPYNVMVLYHMTVSILYHCLYICRQNKGLKINCIEIDFSNHNNCFHMRMRLTVASVIDIRLL